MKGPRQFSFLRQFWAAALLVCVQVLAGAGISEQSELVQQLAAQGVTPDSIQDFDQSGLPIVCGTVATSSSEVLAAKGNPHDPPPPTPDPAVPSGYWRWECVPNAIRADGIDTFRIEVEPNRPVTKVILDKTYTGPWTKYVSGPLAQDMRDDGLEGDRVAGDGIFTSALITCDTNGILPNFSYAYQPLGPFGIIYQPAGRPLPIELNGYTNNDSWFSPEIAIVRPDIPACTRVQLSPTVQVSDHFINVSTTNHYTQKSIRYFTSQHLLSQATYSALPDAFDFFMCFSTERIEHTNASYSANFVAGIHVSAQDNYTGTGRALNNNSAAYGSSGRLLGVNIVDFGNRGVHTRIFAHEMMHQWAAHIDPSFGITYSGHYLGACDAASLVGGAKWVDQGNGTYYRNCEGLTHAPPLDLYLMGLIPGSNVPPVLKANPAPSCYDYMNATNITGQVTIGDLQALYGVRTPAPPNARTNFSLGFVAETYGRLLNDTEMTFYEILAREYTKKLPPSEPDIELDHGWFTITRYFDESLSSWSSEVLPLLRPNITGVTPLPNSTVAITATGYPGKVYDLFRTTNFVSWQAVGTATAATNGVCTFTDSTGAIGTPARFYRAAMH